MLLGNTDPVSHTVYEYIDGILSGLSLIWTDVQESIRSDSRRGGTEAAGRRKTEGCGGISAHHVLMNPN